MQKYWKNLILCGLTAVLALFTACSNASETASSVQAEEPPAAAESAQPETDSEQPVIEVGRLYDMLTATDLENMVDGADYIVAGQYTGFDSTWNMSINASKDDQSYTEGRLYRFAVEEVLFGEIEEEEILVNQKFSATESVTKTNAVLNQAGEIIQPATESQTFNITVHYPLYIEPDLSMTYVLFLCKNTRAENYYGACEPFMVQVTPDETVQLKSNLIGQETIFHETVYGDNGEEVLYTTWMPGPIPDTISGESYEDFRLAILDCLEQ